ncbi:hypothetical protein S1361_36725 [Streptomyces cyanogenus]|uniref:Uncharacterized protein n=1 Tax=Streptomyces cyanogenus TaxID=80860 RepID=A0ABX7U2F9_STRCY|nr:hypothetical protein S1361_36725 [Streptomyces cyanogenus]
MGHRSHARLRFPLEGTTSHAVDPGWVPAPMGGVGAPDDLAAGRRTQVWLATGHDVTPATGGSCYHRRTQTPHPAARDEAFRARDRVGRCPMAEVTSPA